MTITASTTTEADTVTTVAELKALPAETVIRNKFGSVFEKEERGWYTIGVSQPECNVDYLVPAIILYRP